jgi:hypothetical protein
MAAKVSLRQVQEAKRKAEEPATLRKKMLEMEENNRKLQEGIWPGQKSIGYPRLFTIRSQN